MERNMYAVRPEALTDAEFVDMLYKSFGNSASLPPAIQKEVLYRIDNNGRDEEKQASANNPNQLSLF